MSVRTRNLFDPASDELYKLSRSKLELFVSCPRCFYLDRRVGVARPDGPSFSLNLAVDALLKREFDVYRAKGEPHALMTIYGVDAVPLMHPSLDDWRNARKGIGHLHEPTKFFVYGAIDDAWVSPQDEIFVVDYKATSTPRAITLDGSHRDSYKRQLEIYQWLLRKNGFRVSSTGYLVFVNGDAGRESFDGKLEFATTLHPYEGSDAWIEDALHEARLCLCRNLPPQPHPACEWCEYRKTASASERWI